MITTLLLLPVVAVLLWLYWYLLPDGRRWTLADALLLVGLTALAAIFHHYALNTRFEGAGPMWPEVVSAAGVYIIYAAGLSAGLVWRRHKAGGG